MNRQMQEPAPLPAVTSRTLCFARGHLRRHSIGKANGTLTGSAGTSPARTSRRKRR
jgi:hypothetical protein